MYAIMLDKYHFLLIQPSKIDHENIYLLTYITLHAEEIESEYDFIAVFKMVYAVSII